MRRILLPVAVCVVLGAVITAIVIVNRGEDPVLTGAPTDWESSTGPARGEETDKWGDGYRKTRTTIDEFMALSELERAFQRGDIKQARHFQALVAEKMDWVMESEKHSKTLLDLIRDHGANSDDPVKRDILFQLLRVFPHPEATDIVRNQFYAAKTQEERLVLLDAMSRPYHDTELASVHVVDIALNSEDFDDRAHAFYLMEQFSEDPVLIFETAKRIYEGTTRPFQSRRMLEEISRQAVHSHKIRQWALDQIPNASMDELPKLLSNVENWGGTPEANALEELMERYPAMSPFLQERAMKLREKIRIMERGGEGGPTEQDLRDMEEAKRREREFEEEQEREREGGSDER